MLIKSITKRAMEEQGLRYEDYLPAEYKRKIKKKKPYSDKLDDNTVLFYWYGDGTVSEEYDPVKARLRFDRLQDKSGMNWKKGYDPKGVVIKDGWYGEFDETDTWVRREGVKKEKETVILKRNTPILELIKDGDNAILFDPGMLLLSPVLLFYMTESGEPYGNLEMDTAATINEIKKAMEVMGIEKIDIIGGIESESKEKLALYKDILKDITHDEIKVISKKEVNVIKNKQRKEAKDIINEAVGLKLAKKNRYSCKLRKQRKFSCKCRIKRLC